ncbi:MAG: strawberry notch C-terminal domain-containing protein [Luteimonas sp.]
MAYQPRPSLKLINWAALNAQDPGIRLVACKKAWGAVRLQITGCPKLTEEQRTELGRLGFRKPRLARTDTLVRKDTKITLAELRGAFPNATQVSMPQEDAAHVAPFRLAARDDGDPEIIAAKLEELTVLPIGHNHEGVAVFEGDEGRYLVMADGMREIEPAEGGDARFLRAPTDRDMSLCADAFVLEIVGGRNMRMSDLVRFASAITGIEHVRMQQSPRLREIQEAVEAALVRRVRLESSEHADSYRAIFEAAKRLMEGQPSFTARTSTSVMLQQYSTPLPMAVAAQVALGDTRGRTVLEPTVGHGALLSTLEASSIVGVDLDGRRLDNLQGGRDDIEIRQGDARIVDFTSLNRGEKFDQIICNPPFGSLDKTIDWRGLKVRRLDHQVLLRSLDARKDDGVGVYIIGADSYLDTKAGKVTGASRYLFNWLADHYHVDVAEVPGSVFTKQGATFPVRMVVVGKRAGDGEQVPDDLSLLASDDAIFAWCERMREKYAQELAPVSVENTFLEMEDNAEPSDIDAPADAVQSGSQGNVSDAEENSFQSPYPARSQISEATSMIPRNMLTPLREALDEVVEEHGDIDEFVASRLGWTVEEMREQEYLSPEQVDAVALGVHQAETTGGDRGVLSGDMTGLGKGRIAAAMALYYQRRHKVVTFLTETPTLFTDFWRDLRDIGAHGVFNPMIVNAGVSIIDPISGDKLVAATPASVVNAAVASGKVPDGYNLVLATYSQFNRDRNSAQAGKSRWITTSTENGALILDESHNAAGESNTNRNIAAAIDTSNYVTYSSATSMKEGKNVSAYVRLFPPTVDIGSLPETLRTGGEVLQEVLSGMLARDGVFIRREHDLSNLTFAVRPDTEERQARNRILSDALAGILEAMNLLSGDLNNAVTERNKDIKKEIAAMPEAERQGNRMGAVAVNFGSRLYNIYRQFLLALQVDLAADRAVDALESGKKPVIVLENTMEALLQDIIAASKEELLGDGDEDELSADAVARLAVKGEVDLGAPLSFRDVLHRTLKKLTYYNETNRYGNVHQVELASKESDRVIERIGKLIDEMPDLPVSPIDQMRERIEQAGFACDELSGRKLSIQHRENSAFAVALEQRPKAEIVRRFNTGQTDALILTRAGSTGISLHASEKFPDKRQRRMIEAQPAADVNKRVQFFGRVNRKGQVHSPEIETLSTGLIGQARPIAMQNAKLRKLSANTTANQDNAALDATVPDFINTIGDQVAYRYLESRPDIARRLDIEMDDEDAMDGRREEAYYINKLTSRLVMLRVSDQEDIYEALTTEYVRVIQELDEKGINPLKSKELDIRCREVKREVFESGDPTSRSVFDHPVYLKTVEYEVERYPLRSETVQAYIDAHSQRFEETFGAPCNKILCAISDALAQERPNAIAAALGTKHKSVEEALMSNEPNGPKKVQARYEFLMKTLREIDIGRHVRFTNNQDEPAFGVIAGIGLPKEGQHNQLGAYTVSIAVPGEERLIERSFYGLREDSDFRVLGKYLQLDDMMEKFDQAVSGKRIEQRLILDGNLFKAAQMAAQHRLGASAVYTDQEGNRLRGVVLSKTVSAKELSALPIRIETPEMVVALLERDRSYRFGSRNSGSIAMGEDTIIWVDGNDCVIQCPGTKAKGGSVFGNPDLVAITDDFSGSRNSMTARFPRRDMQQAIEVMYRGGLSFYAQASLREVVNELSMTVYKNESGNERKYIYDDQKRTATAAR